MGFCRQTCITTQSAFFALKYRLSYFICNINSLIAIVSGYFYYLNGYGRRNVYASADKSQREKFSALYTQDYYYANQANVFELPSVNSRCMYIELKDTLGSAGVTPPQIFNVIISGILWLIDTGNNANTNTNKDPNALMLDVDPSDLASVLLTRENKIRGESFITPLSVEKQLYSKNFEWIVKKDDTIRPWLMTSIFIKHH